MTNDIFDNQSRAAEGEDRHLSLDALSAYLDGQLTETERGSASTHLSTCAICQEELRSLQATISLVRGLPEMKPARSFQLGPEYAEGAVTTGWLGRLFDWLPALRVATAAVAVLLVVVVAGDVLTNQDEGGQETFSDMAVGTSTVATQVQAPTSTQTDTLMIEEEAPVATDVGNEESAGAAAPEESIEKEGAAQEDTEEMSVMQADNAGEADESRAGQPAQAGSPPAEPAPPEPTATTEPTSTLSPSPTPEPSPTPAPSEPTGTSEGRVSNWRIAEIALALLLVWLIVTLIGANRFRRRS